MNWYDSIMKNAKAIEKGLKKLQKETEKNDLLSTKQGDQKMVVAPRLKKSGKNKRGPKSGKKINPLKG